MTFLTNIFPVTRRCPKDHSYPLNYGKTCSRVSGFIDLGDGLPQGCSTGQEFAWGDPDICGIPTFMTPCPDPNGVCNTYLEDPVLGKYGLISKTAFSFSISIVYVGILHCLSEHISQFSCLWIKLCVVYKCRLADSGAPVNHERFSQSKLLHPH